MHSQDYFDVWTVVHHLYGAYFLSVLHMSLSETIFIAVCWELFEQTSFGIRLWNDADYAGDSVRNAVVDIAATASGWIVAGTSTT